MTFSETLKKLEEKMENMLSLEVLTVVQTAQPTERDERGIRKVVETSKDAKVMRTSIDLLEGDLRTEIDPSFVHGEYESLRSFHAERERQALAMVKANIELVRALTELLSRQQPRSTDQDRT